MKNSAGILPVLVDRPVIFGQRRQRDVAGRYGGRDRDFLGIDGDIVGGDRTGDHHFVVASFAVDDEIHAGEIHGFDGQKVA